MAFETLQFAREERFVVVTLNRPPANAISAELVTELNAALASVEDDDAVRSVIITGAGDKIFCAGADLGSAFSGGSVDTFIRFGNSVMRKIERFPKPVIAAINGHALGGGSELTLCCDFRIMVEDGRSRIGQTESSLGIIPGAGGTQRLPRLIGKARALRYIIDSTRLSARDAEAVGWVDQAVAPEAFAETVNERANRLAKAATFAIAMIKDAVWRGYDLPLDDALEIEAANFARAALSDDAAIGIMSFLAKQEPEFTGR